ncbi:MAG TPA: acetate uptake transporter [Chthoniobacterales bacterium]
MSVTTTSPVRPLNEISSKPTVADPAPLGLGGFALTTFVLSAANAGWIPKGGDAVVISLAAAYGGLAQFCAGMWEFKRNNTFGATAFTSFGAFWMAFALLVSFNVAKVPASALPAALGFFLLAWAIFTAYMTVAATALSRPVLTVFVLLTITYLVLAIGSFSSQAGITVLGGYLGILTAIAAWYASAKGIWAATLAARKEA